MYFCSLYSWPFFFCNKANIVGKKNHAALFQWRAFVHFLTDRLDGIIDDIYHRRRMRLRGKWRYATRNVAPAHLSKSTDVTADCVKMTQPAAAVFKNLRNSTKKKTYLRYFSEQFVTIGRKIVHGVILHYRANDQTSLGYLYMYGDQRSWHTGHRADQSSGALWVYTFTFFCFFFSSCSNYLMSSRFGNWIINFYATPKFIFKQLFCPVNISL